MPRRYDDEMDPADRDDLAEFDPRAAARFRNKDNIRAGKGKRSGHSHVPGTTADYTARLDAEDNGPETGSGIAR